MRIRSIMKYFDKIFSILQDSKWHTLDEINENIGVNPFRVQPVKKL